MIFYNIMSQIQFGNKLNCINHYVDFPILNNLSRRSSIDVRIVNPSFETRVENNLNITYSNKNKIIVRSTPNYIDSFLEYIKINNPKSPDGLTNIYLLQYVPLNLVNNNKNKINHSSKKKLLKHTLQIHFE